MSAIRFPGARSSWSAELLDGRIVRELGCAGALDHDRESDIWAALASQRGPAQQVVGIAVVELALGIRMI